MIGGGANVGMQNLYMKTQARKQRRRERRSRMFDPAFDPVFNFPSFSDESPEGTDATIRTPTQWVTLALRRNLPSKDGDFLPKSSPLHKLEDDNSKTKTRMTMQTMPYVALPKIVNRKWTIGPRI